VRVTYTTRAVRTSEVLRQLGKQTKVDLRATPEMEGEILVVAVKDQPLSDVMARIAAVTSGEWKQDGSIFRLVANETVRRQEERADSAKRVAEVRRAIKSRSTRERGQLAAFAKILAKRKAAQKDGVKTKFDPEVDLTYDEMTFGGTSADQLAITSLLQGIDADALAQVELGGRVVFSTSPTRTQQKLGDDAAGVIDACIRRHSEEAAAIPAPTGAERDQEAAPKATPIGQVSKDLLVVRQAGRVNHAFDDIALKLYDSKGTLVYNSTATLPLGDAPNAAGPSPQGTRQAISTRQTTLIEYSSDSKALTASMNGVMANGFRIKLNPELRRKVLQPNLYDPLSFVQTDEVMAFAELRGKPLIADLPDDWELGGMELFRNSQARIAQDVERNINEGHSVVDVSDDAFTMIKPASPFHSRSIRVDRQALATLIGAVQEKGVPSLEDLAEYAVHSPDPAEGGFSAMYLLLFVPGEMEEGLSGRASWDMLRFYGRLSPDARSGLLRGGKVSMGNLSMDQRTTLEKMTYGADAQLIVDDARRPAVVDYRQEPTEIAPSGLPSGGYIELNVKHEMVAAPQEADGSSAAGPLSLLGPNEMAVIKLSKESKDVEFFGDGLPPLSKLRIGDRSILKFTFHLAPQVSVMETLGDHRFAANSRLVSENDLPGDFQKQIASRMEALKKSPPGNLGGLLSGADTIHPVF